ncbi:MAG: type 2 isopentenyl-diphosphate Delta-isomerase [Polyangiaceae bacterium]
MSGTLAGRKSDHLTLCATGDVGFRSRTTLLEAVKLVHDALPDLSVDEIDPGVTVLGKRLAAPIVIAAMTGGTEEAGRVNRELASIAEERGYGFGLGSQRAMHVKAGVAGTYAVREAAPTTLILGNVGIVQATAMNTEAIVDLVRGVGADALCVHLNPAMELVQPHGDRDFRGGQETLARLRRELPFPLVVKETGCGLSPALGRRLRAIGIENVDVSGAGGTSWVGVETKRAEEQGDAKKRALGDAFWDWGIPTAASVGLLAPLGFSTLVATGGIQSGLDVARALALGAHAAGIARPVLRAFYDKGREGALAFLDGVEAELRAAMLLTGSRDVASLRRAPKIVTGELHTWLTDLSVDRAGA